MRDSGLFTPEDKIRLLEIDKRLENDPFNIEILLEKGFLLHYNAVDPEAISVFQQVLKIDPMNLKAYIWICESIHMLGDVKLLKKYAETASQIYPKRAEFYNFLAYATDEVNYHYFDKVKDLIFLT